MPNEWMPQLLFMRTRGISKIVQSTMKLNLSETLGKSDWTYVKNEALVSEYQHGFMLGRSTLEAIHLHRRLMEKKIETYEDLHMVFIDLEKTSDRVPKEVMRWVLAK